mgnify:CR=1 FL=1
MIVFDILSKVKKMPLRVIINRVINRVSLYWYSRIDICSTIFFNFRALPIIQAIKFPIFIYQNTYVIGIGEIHILSKIKTGMIRIGIDPVGGDITKIIGAGKYNFEGEIEICSGAIIENNGEINFGNNVYLASNVRLACFKKINIGNCSRIGYATKIMDSDYHFLFDTVKNTIHRNTVEVNIDRGAWILDYSKIMKGSFLPKNCIVIGGSLVNKDYRDYGENLILAGTPAKVIGNAKRRIFNKKEELKLRRFFEENPDIDSITLEIKNIDEFCYRHFFDCNR